MKKVIERGRGKVQDAATMTENYSLNLLKTLSEAYGISGHEADIRKICATELVNCGEYSCDKTGSFFCSRGEGRTVMLAAHMDEVGMMVQNITAEGFVQFVGIGGWWTHTLPSQKMVIVTAGGKRIPGIVGSRPPHFLSEAQRNALQPMDALFIDIGAETREQAMNEMGVRLGDPIIPDVKFSPTAHPHRYVGKALDDRVGLAAMIEAVKLLSDKALSCRLVAAATVQEEVGVRGAKTAGTKIQPDCAIILEAPPADDTPGFALSESQGKMGKGVQIRLYDPTAIMNPRWVKLIRETAEKAEIPFQMTVRRSGGTDAGALHLVGEGVPCVVLGVPARYIHAHHGMMDMRDYRAMVDLLVAVVQALNTEEIDGLTRYL